MQQQRGFTLIELMVGIGLTAMLLSMAVPALDMFANNARQTGAVNDFVSSMHAARSTAVTTNSRVTVCPTINGLGCAAVSWDEGWIVFTDPNSNQIVDADETIISTGNGIDGLTIGSTEFASFLTYRPNGRVMNASVNGSAGEFTVCDSRGATHAKVLIVDLSGRPRLSEYLSDGSAPSCTS
jgi:type IV fimbrial biogenesis protein FimT